MKDKESGPNNWGFGQDDPVNAVAGALYGHHVNLVREEAATYDIQGERLRKTYEAARSEADRSAAILLFALAEDLMLHGLRQHLNGEVTGGWQEISSGNGLLATANDRLTLLALLAWIDPTVYADLRIMKAIRNRFAHHPDVMGFGEVKITSYIASLSPQEKLPLKKVNATELALSQRQSYLLRAGSVIMRLVRKLAVAPAARRERVAPGHVHQGDWSELPVNIQELHRIFAEHVLSVVPNAAGSLPAANLLRRNL